MYSKSLAALDYRLKAFGDRFRLIIITIRFKTRAGLLLLVLRSKMLPKPVVVCDQSKPMMNEVAVGSQPG